MAQVREAALLHAEMPVGAHEDQELDPSVTDEAIDRAGLIRRLNDVAVRARATQAFKDEAAALKAMAEIQGFVKSPAPVQQMVDADHMREVICAQAKEYGMVWPKGGE